LSLLSRTGRMRPPRHAQSLLLAIVLFLLATTSVGRPSHISAPASILPTKAASNGQPPEPGLPEFIQAQQNKLDPRGGLAFQHAFDIGNGWNMYYSSWPAAILPVQPAAWALVNLYMSIVLQAKAAWKRGPPQHSYTMSFGKILIVMVCPQKPIPWQFVVNFAEKLLSITEGGWTGVYSVMLSQAATDVSIVVELKILG